MAARLGKLRRELMKRVVFDMLGARDEALIVPPGIGLDFSVIRLGDYTLIVEVDPFFIVPEYGWERSAWFAVHILASDVAVSGVPPRFMFVDLNLPPDMSDEDFAYLWSRVHEECLRLGVSIAGGHTGRYEGGSFPMLGGAVMVGVTRGESYVTPAMARPGDVVIMTKGPAIETAGILAVLYPRVLEEAYGRAFAERAQEIFWLQSVVRDALTLSRLGLRTGVTAMHDATEYGVWGALNDISEASGCGIRVYEDRLFVRDDVKLVLQAFSRLTGVQADPFAAISEGTLIATVRPETATEALEALAKEGIEAAVIGEVTHGRGVELVKRDLSKIVVEPPDQDPFWALLSEVRRLAGGRT